MPKVNMSTELPVSADQVWEYIGSFNGLPDWHPAVERSELKNRGEVRELSLVGGGKIIEKLEKLDNGERLYTYTITDSPLPVADYTATIHVRETKGGNAIVEWSSHFEASGAAENDAVKAIQDIYQAGFDNLKKIYGD
ncbi:MAG: SRPBCC family protein [Thiotrichales bacterium]|nr:SRPBCC family protein [Thiotrichales bacterium]